MRFWIILSIFVLNGCTDNRSIYIESSVKCPERCAARGGKWTGLLRSARDELQCVCDVPLRDEQ